MKICVLIKQVPDKDSSLNIADDHLTLVENNITWVSNESDNYALEEALLLKENMVVKSLPVLWGKILPDKY